MFLQAFEKRTISKVLATLLRNAASRSSLNRTDAAQLNTMVVCAVSTSQSSLLKPRSGCCKKKQPLLREQNTRRKGSNVILISCSWKILCKRAGSERRCTYKRRISGMINPTKESLDHYLSLLMTSKTWSRYSRCSKGNTYCHISRCDPNHLVP